MLPNAAAENQNPFLPRSDEKQDEVGADSLLGGNAADWSVGSASFTHRTGPGEKGIRLGDIGRVKRDLTPYLEVTLPSGRGVWLRENTYAVYRDGDWSPIRNDVPDPWGAHPDPERDGWIPIRGVDDAVRGFDLRIRILLDPPIDDALWVVGLFEMGSLDDSPVQPGIHVDCPKPAHHLGELVCLVAVELVLG